MVLLYPRTTENGKLVANYQMVDYKEHLHNRHRMLFLTGILAEGAAEYLNLLMAMDTVSHDPIRLIITSLGGELDSTFLLYDTMKLLKSPVETVGRFCASGATLILASGRKRYLFPHAKVMLHLPVGQMGGDPKDWEIQLAQMHKYQDKIIDILHNAGVKKSREEILADIDRDFWLEPKEAIEYGLADEILKPEIWQGWIEKGGDIKVKENLFQSETKI